MMPAAFFLIVITIIATACTLHHKTVRSLKGKLRELTDEELQIFFDGNVYAYQASPGYGFIESQPFNKEFEIPSGQLQIFHEKKLGSGAFGLVLRGTLKGSNKPGSITAVDIPVAVKTVKPNVEVSIFVALLTEIKVMCFVGEHPHIVGLYGAQTTKIRTRKVYIAQEFCETGDLLNFLKKNRAFFDDLIKKANKIVRVQSPGDATTATALNANQMTTISISEPSSVYSGNQSAVCSTFDLIKWALQISNGMEFLGSKNVIHGDLAARNVLLTEDKTAKISDFGLSRQLYNYSTYKKKTKTPLPWKWMAIESLRDSEFSVQSDVWSFGVTLFEMFSLGTTPYPGRDWTKEFLDDLVAGLRVNSPMFGNDDIRILMMDCMKQQPLERIKFQEIGQRFIDIRKKLELNLNPDSINNYIVT